MIITILNEKGGTGKTTTAVSLAAALAARGESVAVADLDPQRDALHFQDAETQVVWCAATGRGLARALERAGCAWSIVDCPAVLGPDVAMALRLSQLVVVPVNCEYMAARGLKRLVETVGAARAGGNPGLRLRVLLTMWNPASQQARDVAEAAERAFVGELIETRIRRSRLFEWAARDGQPITTHSPRSAGAHDYRLLAEEIMSLCH